MLNKMEFSLRILASNSRFTELEIKSLSKIETNDRNVHQST
jgi:hypothetical protein